MKTALTVPLLTIGALLIAAPAFAQHHHDGGHGHTTHHGGHATQWQQNRVIYDPHGQHVTSHHQDYQHVIPSHPQHHSTYYTHNDTHYYYQAPPVAHHPVHSAGVQVAMRPETPIQPASIAFGGFSHVDDLSGRLNSLANEFCLDLHHNYQHNPGYAEAYREAYQILQAAKSAHANEHQGDKAALARSLGDLDPLFHHVQQDVTGWSRDHHRQIGNLGIIDKMSQIEALLHHLLHDVGVRPAHDGGGAEQAPPPGGGIEIAPPPAP